MIINALHLIVLPSSPALLQATAECGTIEGRENSREVFKHNAAVGIYPPTSADQTAVTDAPFLSRRKVSKRGATQNAIFQAFYSQQHVKGS